MNQKGFAPIGIIIAVFAAITVLGGYFAWRDGINYGVGNQLPSPCCGFYPPLFVEHSTSTKEIDTSLWKTYRNEQYGFEFKYPSDFFAEPENGMGGEISLDVRNFKRSDVISRFPQQLSLLPADKMFMEVIYADDFSVSGNPSIQEWLRDTSKEYKENNEVLDVWGVGTLVSQNQVSVGNIPALQRIVNYSNKGVNIEVTYYYIIYNSHLFQIILHPTVGDSGLYSKILSTFKFIEPSSNVKPRIVDHFACSDNCPGPSEKYMIKIYEGVTDESICKSFGGTIYTYYGWGTYTVCKAE